jgi:hypothetical protein
MNLYSEAHISRIYVQGERAIVRLVHRLVDKIEDLEAQPEIHSIAAFIPARLHMKGDSPRYIGWRGPRS